MRENDVITGLFQNRLRNAKIEVREGFWEELQNDLTETGKTRIPPFRIPWLHRPVAAAAAVILLLGAASATFWYFSPQTEINDALTQITVVTPKGNLTKDIAQESFPSIGQANTQPPIIRSTQTDEAKEVAEEEALSVNVSITITQRMYGNVHTANGHYVSNGNAQEKKEVHSASSSDSSGQEAVEKMSKRHVSIPHRWAWKAAIGTSLIQGETDMPITASLTAERTLGKRVAMETGIQYSCLPVHSGNSRHTITVPVRVHALLASSSHFDWYATTGGAIEKPIGKGCSDEPVRLAASAGIGVRYKLSDRLALFAEPFLSHRFGGKSETEGFNSGRPTNLNLLCGVRMSY